MRQFGLPLAGGGAGATVTLAIDLGTTAVKVALVDVAASPPALLSCAAEATAADMPGEPWSSSAGCRAAPWRPGARATAPSPGARGGRRGRGRALVRLAG